MSSGTSPSEIGVCCRCGMTRRTSATRRTPLCRDCKEVVRHLGEEAIWEDDSPLMKAMRTTMRMEAEQRM